jgi:hypothetical protein
VRSRTVKDLEAKIEMADDTVDAAFDSAVARRCDRAGCQEAGVHRPVLLLQPGRDYTGRPMRMPLGIVVCDRHRETTADAYLTDEMWRDIVAGFKARGTALPHRASTRLDFVPQGPPRQDV